jgi:Ser/Thr protein kinase RdoA (MazF antagonist)
MSGASDPASLASPPAQVLAAWGLAGCPSERVAGGLINATFLVRPAGREPVVLQRLHPIFAAEVNLDIEAITDHLAAAGLVTPRLVPTAAGERWVLEDPTGVPPDAHESGFRKAARGGDGGAAGPGWVWRALTWLDGVTVHAVPHAGYAAAAGALVGRFHRALAGYEREFAFRRSGVHDTAAHLGKLARAVTGETSPAMAEAIQLGREILDAGARLPPLGDLPRRVMHGDLKISNILFERDAERPRAICLIDLDTLGHQTVAYEMGDALRSWCNPAGEDTVDTRFDLDVFDAAMQGYAEGLDGLLGPAEIASLVGGLEVVCIELAARFCVDAVEDRYFGWDPARFDSRRHHNLVRARGQLHLGRAVAAARPEAGRRVAAAFAR